MTVMEKAQEIVEAGMDRDEMFKFFNATKEVDVLSHIALFGLFGIDQDTIWNLYEEWQEA